jgi:hypothetical protein
MKVDEGEWMKERAEEEGREEGKSQKGKGQEISSGVEDWG